MTALAMDRATVRSYDADGRLKVELTNISKANICGYRGSEIGPELDPNRIYQLLRDPEELAKAADTFNNIPLLSRHVPVTADNHRPELVIGSTGTDAVFEAPYLKNSLVIWARDAIDAIEDETQKELSCAYRFRVDMTPGAYEGEKYDGRMIDIVGNHVAVVSTGRAGPDVVIQDSMPVPPKAPAFDFSNFTERSCQMATKMSRKAALTQGALITFLAPRLAQDAAIDLTPVLAGVTHKNFGEKKAGIVTAITAAAAGKLAQDASIDGMAALLDSIEKVQIANDEDLPEPDSKTNIVAEDEDDEDDKKKKVAEDDDEDDKKKDKVAEDEDDDDKKDDDKVTKTAMDAAIAAATKATTARVMKAQADIREAENAVRPYVGTLSMAHDSAEGVYRTALKQLGVAEADTIHASALPAILKMQPVPGTKPAAKPGLAMDSKQAASFAERYPMATRIGRA